jgi:hypothetical protein
MASQEFARKLSALGAHPDRDRIKDMTNIASVSKFDQLEVQSIVDVLFNALRQVGTSFDTRLSYFRTHCFAGATRCKACCAVYTRCNTQECGGSLYLIQRISRCSCHRKYFAFGESFTLARQELSSNL